MDLFKLRALIGLDTSEYEKGLKNSSSLFDKTAKSIKKSAVALGKAVAVGIGAAATAVGALVKQSVQAYADYEQLVGGIETLFGSSGQTFEEYSAAIGESTESIKAFQKANGLAVDGIIGPQTLAAMEKGYKAMGTAQADVLKNASIAYKTAGKSANEYMETVTGFSASLISSLGGDTKKAAELADQAIIDMSDNANKMGTDIAAIEYAYQGFAKQNYTMLDNLKLGYGGTKAEMERLLQDAEKLTGKKYDLSNFADITEAIHAIQTEMGITGTTAREASSTISGSIASMKASWQNLLVAISADDLPFADYVNEFVESAATAADNLIPRIATALQGVVSLVDALAPVIIEKLPSLVAQLLPAVLGAATGLFTALVEAFPGLVQALMACTPMLIDGVVNIFNALVTALPEVLQVIVDALPALLEAIIVELPNMLPALIDGIAAMIVTLCASLGDLIRPIIEYMPEIIAAIVSAIIANLPALLEAGGQLLLGLLGGMIMMLGSIPEVLVAIWDAIVGGIKALFGIHSPSKVMMEIGQFIMQGLIDGITALLGTLGAIWEEIKTTVITTWSAITTGISDAWETIKSGVSTAINNVQSTMAGVWNTIKGAVASVWTSIKTVIQTVWENIKTKVSDAVEAVRSKLSEVWTSIRDTVASIWTTIKTVIQTVWENIKTNVSDAIENVRMKVAGVFNSVKATVANIWDNIKSGISGAWESIKTNVTSAVNNVRTTVAGVFNGVKATVTTIWDNIKSTITDKIESARDKVSSVIDAIRSFFDFEFEWPHIPLPHFSVTPKGWEIGDLLKGSVPSLGISWYNRAMNNPMLLRGATIFGMQDGQFLGGGDAGGEVVAGANTVARLIYDAVRSAMSGSFGGIVVNQNIYSEAKTAADLMQEARWEAERAVLTGV